MAAIPSRSQGPFLHFSFDGPERRPRLIRLLLLAGFLACGFIQADQSRASERSQPLISTDSLRTLISRQLYEEAERESRSDLRVLAPGSAAYADVLDILVEALWRQDTAQPADAESLASAAVELRRALHGESSPGVADALTALGRTQRNSGHLDGARLTLERAIALRKRIGSSDSKLADDLSALATVERRAKNPEKAIALQEQVLELRSHSLPPGHRDITRTQVNLALAYSSANRLAEARRLYEAAVRSFEAGSPPDSQGLGQVLENLTSTLLKLGDAKAAYQTAVHMEALYSRKLPPTHPLVGHAEEQIANAEGKLGHYQDAVRHFGMALAILNQEDRTDDPTRARLLLNLGDQWLGLDAPDSALENYRQATDLYRKIPNAQSFEAEAWWRQGIARYHKGEIAIADSLERGALEKRESLEREESEAIYGNRHDLAVLRLLSGRLDDALSLDIKAIRGRTAELSINIASMTEDEALAQTKGINYSIATSALTTIEGSAKAADLWDAIIRSRALVLDEMAARRQRAASVGDYADLVHRRAQVARDLSQLVQERSLDDSLRGALDATLQRREEIEKELASRNAAFQRGLARAGVGFAEVAKALGSGEALVGFVRFSYWDAAKVLPAVTLAGRAGKNGAIAADGAVYPRYAAFLIKGGDRYPGFVLLGDANRIDSLARDWRNALGSSEQGPGRDKMAAALGESLRRAIWDPLAGRLAGASTVLIVPDGELHMVNLAALPTGKGRYLVEDGPTVHMLTVERDIPLLLAPARSGKGLLAVGGVDFNRREPTPDTAYAPTTPLMASAGSRGLEDCVNTTRRALPSLPGSLLEARQVSDSWSRVYAGEPVSVLSGTQPTESVVLASAARCRALHLATHGFFSHVCSDTRQASEGGDPLIGYPLLRSGIALAGSNQHDKPSANGDDGILTAEEIATTDLSSLDWVVLSACESGVGEVTPGEGVYGLRRALAIAGARTAIMSLWKVDDLATQRWMRHLYEARFEEKLPVAEALRAASIRFLKEQRAHGQSVSPSTWGAFIATGAWL